MPFGALAHGNWLPSHLAVVPRGLMICLMFSVSTSSSHSVKFCMYLASSRGKIITGANHKEKHGMSKTDNSLKFKA